MIYNVAVDLGASSGRVILSRFDQGLLKLEEIHRFSNGPIKEGLRWCWDIDYLKDEIIHGLKKIGQMKLEIASIAFDTWGVDYGLLNASGDLMGNPISYRDESTLSIMDEVHDLISQREMFDLTGVQACYFNSLYRFYEHKKNYEKKDDLSGTLLFMPSLLAYIFSGIGANEYTIASTSQLMNIRSGGYCDKIINALEFNRAMLPKIVKSGQVIGPMKSEIAELCGINKNVQVIAVPGHDTACAVAAKPNTDKSVFIILGTWTIVGAELMEPMISDRAFDQGFTNEAGVFDRTRFLKNIIGLWVLNQTKKGYEERFCDISFDEITEIAIENKKLEYLVDLQNERFNNPVDMYAEVESYIQEIYKLQKVTFEIMIVGIFNGMVEAILSTIKVMESMGIQVETLNILGGGVKNRHLIELIREKSGKKLTVGPTEASAIGNALMQLYGLGEVDTLESLRGIAEKSLFNS